MCTPFRVRAIGAPNLGALCARVTGRPLACTVGEAARDTIGAGRLAAAGAEAPPPPRCWAAANKGSASIAIAITENRVVAEPFITETLLMTREPFVSLLRKMRLGLPWFHHPMVLGLPCCDAIALRALALAGPLVLFPRKGMCYKRARRGTCREARGGAG